MLKFDAEKSAVFNRLEDFVQSTTDDTDPVLSINRLFDITASPSLSSLAIVLQELVKTGAVEQVVRVQSPTGVSIADYKSITEVPDEIHDKFTDLNFHVQPENIKTLYILHKGLLSALDETNKK